MRQKKDIPFELSKLTHVLNIIKEAKSVLEQGGTVISTYKAYASYLDSGDGGIKVRGAKEPWSAMHFNKSTQPDAEYPDWGPFFPDIKSFFYAESNQRMGTWILGTPGMFDYFSKNKRTELHDMMSFVEEVLQVDQWSLSQERTRFSSQFEASVFRKGDLKRTVVLVNFGPLKSISLVEEPVTATPGAARHGEGALL